MNILLFLNYIISQKSLWNWNQNISTSTIFKENLPKYRITNTDSYPSACNNNYNDNCGYACPHMMMFSTDMILASIYDNLDEKFYYATAGSSNDDDCGKCFQVKPLDAERVWDDNLSRKQLIIQNINSGYDVIGGQFDIFMGAGGFGYFTSCNIDCQSRYCQGGSCGGGMYDGTFDDWNMPHYDDPNKCYSGGIKWLNETTDDKILGLCAGLVGDTDLNIYKNNVLIRSCFFSNKLLYHQNFVNTEYTRVKCPEGLTLLTGLKRNDEDNLPRPNYENRLQDKCTGSRNKGHFCITTMQDCCKPSCSWSNKGSPMNPWNKIDTCLIDGLPVL